MIYTERGKNVTLPLNASLSFQMYI